MTNGRGDIINHEDTLTLVPFKAVPRPVPQRAYFRTEFLGYPFDLEGRSFNILKPWS